MAYSVVDCAHNKLCTACPSRNNCEMRKIFYDESQYNDRRTSAFFRAHSAARSRGFSDSECDKLAEESVAIMDHRRVEEIKLHPTYSEI